MTKWLRSVYSNLGYPIFWVISAVLITLTLFQVHATIIAIAVVVVINPDLRPIGWNTGSVYALSRLFWLILGIIWLGWVMFNESFLREGKQLGILRLRVTRLFITIVVIYLVCYLIMLLLS